MDERLDELKRLLGEATDLYKASSLLSWDEEAVLVRMRAEAEPAFPGLQGAFERGKVFSWDREEFSRGAFTWVRPGQALHLTAPSPSPSR